MGSEIARGGKQTTRKEVEVTAVASGKDLEMKSKRSRPDPTWLSMGRDGLDVQDSSFEDVAKALFFRPVQVLRLRHKFAKRT